MVEIVTFVVAFGTAKPSQLAQLNQLVSTFPTHCPAGLLGPITNVLPALVVDELEGSLIYLHQLKVQLFVTSEIPKTI